MIRLVALWLLLAAPAAASDGEQIVAGLSQNAVSITASFVGSEILIYGAVRRESPAPTGAPLEVIITVEGPALPQIVRRKDRRFGIWINRAEVTIDRAPSFYAVASTGPLELILSNTEDLRHKITIPRAIRAVGIAAEAEDAPTFVDALLRIQTDAGLYSRAEGDRKSVV